MKSNSIRTYFLICSSALILGTQANAQQDAAYITKLENKSHKAYLAKDYHTALNCLLPLDTLVSYKSHVYDYWIGICLLSTENKLGAIPYLEHAQRSKRTSFVVNYYLGRAYLFAGRYEEAKKFLNIYARELNRRGTKFEEEKVVSESHKIHVEKTLTDVYGLLAECEANLPKQVLTSSR